MKHIVKPKPLLTCSSKPFSATSFILVMMESKEMHHYKASSTISSSTHEARKLTFFAHNLSIAHFLCIAHAIRRDSPVVQIACSRDRHEHTTPHSIICATTTTSIILIFCQDTPLANEWRAYWMNERVVSAAAVP